MFDIGFWELSIIGVVALIVIGPERLPAVAKTVGLWVGQMKRFVGSMKMEIDKELKADELKKILQKQADSAGIHEIIEEGKSALNEVQNDLNEAQNTIHSEVNSPVIDDSSEFEGDESDYEDNQSPSKSDNPESITVEKTTESNG